MVHQSSVRHKGVFEGTFHLYKSADCITDADMVSLSQTQTFEDGSLYDSKVWLFLAIAEIFHLALCFRRRGKRDRKPGQQAYSEMLRDRI